MFNQDRKRNAIDWYKNADQTHSRISLFLLKIPMFSLGRVVLYFVNSATERQTTATPVYKFRLSLQPIAGLPEPILINYRVVKNLSSCS